MAKKFDDPVLRQWQAEATAGEFDIDGAADWYARVQEMRNMADYYERGLVRYLKWQEGLTWAEVADAVGGNLSSKQAAQAKWKRLLGEDYPGKSARPRRKAGSPGQGGRPRGHSASQRLVDLDGVTA